MVIRVDQGVDLIWFKEEARFERLKDLEMEESLTEEELEFLRERREKMISNMLILSNFLRFYKINFVEKVNFDFLVNFVVIN